MSFSTLTRWSGAALMVGGALGALTFLFHPLASNLSAMSSTRWVVVHAVTGVAFLLLLPGLAGLYIRLGDASGVIGFAGFVLASMGSALGIGLLLYIEATVVPVAAAVPAFVELTDPASAAYRGSLALPVFLATVLCFGVGYTLLGIAMWRSATLPRLLGALTVVGGILFALPAPPAPLIVNIAGMLLWGAGLAGTGWQLWRTARPIATVATATAGMQP